MRMTWKSVLSVVAHAFYLLLCLVTMENVGKWNALSFLNDIPTLALAAMAAISLWVMCLEWLAKDKLLDAKLPAWDQRSLRQMQRDAGRKLFRSLMSAVMITPTIQRITDDPNIRFPAFLVLVLAPSYIFRRKPTVHAHVETEGWSTTI